MRNYNTAFDNDNEEGIPANVPMRHYMPSDRIELVKPSSSRPASMREAVEGINVPAPGETWQELAAWRKRYGLLPVTF